MNPISRAVVAALVLGASADIAAAQTAEGPRWLAGDRQIIPHSDHEHHMLYELESTYSKHDTWPRDSTRYTEARMIEALTYMKGLTLLPVVIANHPSRSATGLGVYGRDQPAELRNCNDTAPRIAVCMEGALGHQANAIHCDGSIDPDGWRGSYDEYPTLGGFDQMTARLGGSWDSMLGEGRRYLPDAATHSNGRIL